MGESSQIPRVDSNPKQKGLLKQIRKEKRLEDLLSANPEKTPIGFETERMFKRVLKNLPEGASTKLVKSWEGKAKLGAAVADLVLNTGNYAVNVIIFRQLFRLTHFNINRPIHDEILGGERSRLSLMLIRDVKKHKPLVSMDFQIDKPELIPYIVGAKILYKLRSAPVKFASDLAENFARSEKGQTWLSGIAKKKGFRTEEIVHKMTTGDALRELGSKPQEKLRENQQYVASANVIND